MPKLTTTQLVISFAVLALATVAPAQTSPDTKLEQGAIARVKATLVSQLQPGTPKVTLEYYLQTQTGGGAKIKWEMNDCGEQTGDPADRNMTDPPICVEADVEPARGGVLTLFIAVGSDKTGIKGKPTVFYISFKDAQGTTMELRRLSQIPLELQNAPGS
jgi:hypothetical protein